MDRKEMEARLALLQGQREHAARQVEEWSRTVMRLDGGIGELQFWLAQEVDGYEVGDEEGGDAE